MWPSRDRAPLVAVLGMNSAYTACAAFAGHRAPAAKDWVELEPEESVVVGRSGQVLTPNFGAVARTDGRVVATESHLSSHHYFWVVGLEIVTIPAMTTDDAISVVRGAAGIRLMAGAVAAVECQEGVTDGFGTLVTDSITSLGVF